MSQALEAHAKSAGLPMTSKWDPEKLEREQQELLVLDKQPFLTRIRGYFKLTGPAWMQSAMTLGAGSAVASVVMGASFGYQFLWVQPIAMILGIAMMSALGNIVLTKGERAYVIFGRELHLSIAFLWALTTVVATIIWHFPQYGLVGAAVWDVANVAGVANAEGSRAVEYGVKFLGGIAILGVNIYLVWSYGSKPRGIKLYETFLRWMIRLTILSFLVVVIKTGVNWGALFNGFFAFHLPENPKQWTMILGGIGAAVGINMTFLYPYSILAKGWGKHHKGLARFDLVMSLFVPFVILTSLIIIAMANTMDPQGVVRSDLSPVAAAGSLQSLFGADNAIGRIIFDLGFMGMACGAISAHMVCCGFTCCEMFNLEYTPARYRLFSLVPAIGLLGVAFDRPFWMPVLASAIALTMLPVAYIGFFILQNKRSYLGDAVGRGWKRAAFNAVLILALILAVVGSAIKIKGGVLDKLFPPKPQPEQSLVVTNDPLPV